MDWLKLNSKGILRGSLSKSAHLSQLIWIKMLAMANETRDRDGYLRYKEGEPYTLDMIATICNVSMSQLQDALALFQDDVRDGHARIEFTDDGSIFITNWGEYQEVPEAKKKLDPESARLARAIQARKGAAEFPEEVLRVDEVQKVLKPILRDKGAL